MMCKAGWSKLGLLNAENSASEAHKFCCATVNGIRSIRVDARSHSELRRSRRCQGSRLFKLCIDLERLELPLAAGGLCTDFD